MKTAEQWRLEMMKVIFTAPVRENATVTCDFAKQQDRDAFREVVQKSIDEARAEGFKAGQIAMQNGIATMFEGDAHDYAMDGMAHENYWEIKESLRLVELVRNLPIQDEPHE